MSHLNIWIKVKQYLLRKVVDNCEVVGDSDSEATEFSWLDQGRMERTVSSLSITALPSIKLSKENEYLYNQLDHLNIWIKFKHYLPRKVVDDCDVLNKFCSTISGWSGDEMAGGIIILPFWPEVDGIGSSKLWFGDE